MKKLLTAFLGLGVALSSMAVTYEDYEPVDLVEFEAVPKPAGDGDYYLWRNPDEPHFSFKAAYTAKYQSAANKSYLYHNFRPDKYSEVLGFIEIAGRTLNLYTMPGTLTNTDVIIPEKPKESHFIKYDETDGSLKFIDDKYCFILAAVQFDDDTPTNMFVLDAYEFSGHYGEKDYAGSYPQGTYNGSAWKMTPEDIQKPWYFKFDRIDDLDLDAPDLPVYTNHQAALTAYPNQENKICCWDLVVNYNADTQTLRVYNIAGFGTEMVFNVNVETGRVTGKGDPIPTIWGDLFFGDLSKKDNTLYGTLQNTDDGKCIFKIDPWGVLDGNGNLTTFNRYYDGTIVLNFQIDGLPDEPGDEDPGQGELDTTVKGNGQMTADVDQNENRNFDVSAEYKNGQLTINNFGGSEYPITFNVDLRTGDLISRNKMPGAVYDDILYYFTDFAKKDYYVYGHIENSEDAKESVMTADTWTYQTGRPGLLEVFYNTSITFDFGIPGLLEDSGNDDPGTDDPGTDDPGTDDPGTDDPGTDDPGTDDPGTDDPGTD